MSKKLWILTFYTYFTDTDKTFTTLSTEMRKIGPKGLKVASCCLQRCITTGSLARFNCITSGYKKGLFLTKSHVIRANFGRKFKIKNLSIWKRCQIDDFNRVLKTFRHTSVSNNDGSLWSIRSQMRLDMRLKKHQELIQATKLSGWQPDSSKKIYFRGEFTMQVNSPEMSNELACL